VHLGDDRILADIRWGLKHGRVIISDPIMMVIKPVDLAEPDVNGVFLLIPVLGNGTLVGAA
jgi:hypothetical protein